MSEESKKRARIEDPLTSRVVTRSATKYQRRSKAPSNPPDLMANLPKVGIVDAGEALVRFENGLLVAYGAPHLMAGLAPVSQSRGAYLVRGPHTFGPISVRPWGGGDWIVADTRTLVGYARLCSGSEMTFSPKPDGTKESFVKRYHWICHETFVNDHDSVYVNVRIIANGLVYCIGCIVEGDPTEVVGNGNLVIANGTIVRGDDNIVFGDRCRITGFNNSFSGTGTTSKSMEHRGFASRTLLDIQLRRELALRAARSEASAGVALNTALRADVSRLETMVAQLTRDRSLSTLPVRPTEPPEATEALEMLTCRVCYTNVVDTVLQCSHSLCSACAAAIRGDGDTVKCPRCRTTCRNGQRIIF